MGHPGESIGDIQSQIDAKNIPLKIDVFFPDINEHPVKICVSCYTELHRFARGSIVWEVRTPRHFSGKTAELGVEIAENSEQN